MKTRTLLLFSAAGAVAYSLGATHDIPQQPAGQPAPSFSLTRVGGGTVTAESLRGRPVLLNFWASWCPPCRAELPDLQALSTSCVEVVGIALQSGTADDVAAFAHRRGVTYPLLLGDDGVAAAYRVDGLPTSVLIDAEGRTVASWSGAIDASAVRDAVRTLGPQRC